MKQIFNTVIKFLFILTFNLGSQSVNGAAADIGAEKDFSPAKTAVLVVDVQGDFTTAKDGTLAVPGADDGYIAKVQAYVNDMRTKGYTIAFTQDWHPAGHSSFASTNGIPVDFVAEMWPDHCIQGSEKAKILIDVQEDDIVQQKGTDVAFDSYSGFEDAGKRPTGLADKLRAKGITDVIVLGLATDFCVKFTALDAVKYRFKTAFVEGLSKGIAPGVAAISEMGKAGVVIFPETHA